MDPNQAKQTRVNENGTDYVKRLANNPPACNDKSSYGDNITKIEIFFDVYLNYDKKWMKKRLLGGDLEGRVICKINNRSMKEFLECYQVMWNMMSNYSIIFNVILSIYESELEAYRKEIQTIVQNCEEREKYSKTDLDKFYELYNKINRAIRYAAEEYVKKVREEYSASCEDFKNKVIIPVKDNLKATFYDDRISISDFEKSSLWSVVDSSTTLLGTLYTLDNQLSNGILTKKTLGMIPKYGPAIITVTNLIANWSTSNGPQADLSPISNIISAANAASSIWVNPMFIATTYMGPMLIVIKHLIEELEKLLQTQNEIYYKLFGYNPCRDKKEVFDYLETLMQSEEDNDLPDPNNEVIDYFENKRERLDAIFKNINDTRKNVIKEYKELEAEFIEKAKYTREDIKIAFDDDFFDMYKYTFDKIPTEGSVFKEINKSKFTEWAFEHREWLWVIHYGKLVPNNQASTVSNFI